MGIPSLLTGVLCQAQSVGTVVTPALCWVLGAGHIPGIRGCPKQGLQLPHVICPSLLRHCLWWGQGGAGQGSLGVIPQLPLAPFLWGATAKAAILRLPLARLWHGAH